MHTSILKKGRDNQNTHILKKNSHTTVPLRPESKFQIKEKKLKIIEKKMKWKFK